MEEVTEAIRKLEKQERMKGKPEKEDKIEAKLNVMRLQHETELESLTAKLDEMMLNQDRIRK